MLAAKVLQALDLGGGEEVAACSVDQGTVILTHDRSEGLPGGARQQLNMVSRIDNIECDTVNFDSRQSGVFHTFLDIMPSPQNAASSVTALCFASDGFLSVWQYDAATRALTHVKPVGGPRPTNRAGFAVTMFWVRSLEGLNEKIVASGQTGQKRIVVPPSGRPALLVTGGIKLKQTENIEHPPLAPSLAELQKGEEEVHDDAWIFLLGEKRWIQIEPSWISSSSGLPAEPNLFKRAFHMASLVDRHLLMWGGWDGSQIIEQATVLDVDSWTFSPLSLSLSDFPLPRLHAKTTSLATPHFRPHDHAASSSSSAHESTAVFVHVMGGGQSEVLESNGDIWNFEIHEKAPGSLELKWNAIQVTGPALHFGPRTKNKLKAISCLTLTQLCFSCTVADQSGCQLQLIELSPVHSSSPLFFLSSSETHQLRVDSFKSRPVAKAEGGIGIGIGRARSVQRPLQGQQATPQANLSAPHSQLDPPKAASSSQRPLPQPEKSSEKPFDQPLPSSSSFQSGPERTREKTREEEPQLSSEEIARRRSQIKQIRMKARTQLLRAEEERKKQLEVMNRDAHRQIYLLQEKVRSMRSEIIKMTADVRSYNPSFQSPILPDSSFNLQAEISSLSNSIFANCVKAGWLTIKESTVATSFRAFTVLSHQPGEMKMYESANSKRAELVIPLDHLQFVKQSMSVRHSFDAVTLTSNSYLMTAADDSEMRDWMRSITSVMFSPDEFETDDDGKRRKEGRFINIQPSSLSLHSSRLDEDSSDKTKGKRLMGIFNKKKV